MGFGDQSGSKRSTAEDLPRRRGGQRRPDFVVNCRGRAGHRRGRPRGRGRGDLWIDPRRRRRTAPGRRHGARSGGRRRLRLDRVAGTAAALRDRRPRGRRLPAAAPDGRRHGVYHEDQQDWWWGPPQAALSHQFADLERRLRLPDRVRRSTTTGLSAAARPGAPAGTTRRRCSKFTRCAAFINLTATAGTAGSTVDAAGNPFLELPRSPTISTSQLPRAASRSWSASTRRAGAGEMHRQLEPPAPRSGSGATISRRSSPRSRKLPRAARVRPLHRPPDG